MNNLIKIAFVFLALGWILFLIGLALGFPFLIAGLICFWISVGFSLTSVFRSIRSYGW